MEWTAPDLTNYGGYAEPWKFYLLAVIKHINSPPVFPEVPNTATNAENYIRGSNKVACRAIEIGSGVDLMIRDDIGDSGIEPNTYTGIYYDSPDIWVRNLNLDTSSYYYEHQNPEYERINYVNVRVKNRNFSRNATQGDEYVCLYWSKSGVNYDFPAGWDGSQTFPYTDAPTGGFIDCEQIPKLNPGEDTIIQFEWEPLPPERYTNIDGEIDKESWHFCLLGVITAVGDTCIPARPSMLGEFVMDNNNVAWKNVTIVIPHKSINGVIFVGNSYKWIHAFCLKFKCESNSSTLWQEAELTVKLGTTVYTAWERGGFQGEDIQLIGDKLIRIKAATAKLCNFIFLPNEVGLLDMRFNFLTCEITGQTNYTFHIMQIDEGTNEVLGGEVYEVHKSPRIPFYASGNDVYAFQGDPITLIANDIGEPATYNWYDENGNLVHTGMAFGTVADHERKYKLEVIASADGYKDYADVWVKIVPGKIESIQPNPAMDYVMITCVFNNVSEAYLTISSQTGVVYEEYSLSSSPQSVDFDIAAYTPSRYTVTLFCDGAAVDSKTFVKQ